MNPLEKLELHNCMRELDCSMVNFGIQKAFSNSARKPDCVSNLEPAFVCPRIRVHIN